MRGHTRHEVALTNPCAACVQLTTAMLAEFMSADDTMAAPPGQGTMVALLLVCSSPEDCEFVMRGFRHSANHFADKGRKLMPELHRPVRPLVSETRLI